MLNKFKNNVPNKQIHKLCDGVLPEIYGTDTGRVTGLPSNIFTPSFDPYTLYRELSVLEDPPVFDSKSTLRNPKVKWLTSELRELGLNYTVTSDKSIWTFKSLGISVPFICSRQKPVILYVAGLNGNITTGSINVNRINSTVMGLALAIQLHKTTEYVNAAILFVDNESAEDAASLISETIQRRLFQTSVHSIVELGFLSGKDVVLTGDEESATRKNFQLPVSMAGLGLSDTIPDERQLWNNHLKEKSYDVVTIQSVPERKSAYVKKADLPDPGLAFSSSYKFKALYKVLFQHAIIASSRIYLNPAENDYAYRH